jgi:deazaflavin-dependent oxidoreductase (nitroreductase family)
VSPYRPGRLAGWLFRVPTRLYDWNAGWLLGRRFCQLTHVGRTSGRAYRTVLEVIGTDASTGEVIVVSGFGPRADWYRNLRANGQAEIRIGRRRFRARPYDVDLDRAVHVMVAYERGYRLLAPLLRRVFSGLLGWRYDGSDAARRKLVGELPIVAFTPLEPDPG